MLKSFGGFCSVAEIFIACLLVDFMLVKQSVEHCIMQNKDTF